MAPTICVCCGGRITPATANVRNPNVCLTCEQLLDDVYPESSAELLKATLEAEEPSSHPTQQAERESRIQERD